MPEHEFERCEPGDPARCQSPGQSGQCKYKSVEGYKHCPRHIHLAVHAEKKRAIDAFNFGRYQDKIRNHANSSDIKNLNVEIGVLRMTLEDIVSRCDPKGMDILNYSGKIGDLVIKIKALISTFHQIEKSTGQLMDRDKVMIIATKTVEIVSKYITDPNALEDIANQLAEAIMAVSNA